MPEQWQQLNQRAQQQQKSITELIAEAVEQLLHTPSESDWEARKQRALSIVGRFPAEPDFAQRHGDHFFDSHFAKQGFECVPSL